LKSVKELVLKESICFWKWVFKSEFRGGRRDGRKKGDFD